MFSFPVRLIGLFCIIGFQLFTFTCSEKGLMTNQYESEDFIFLSDSKYSSTAEVDLIKIQAELIYTRITSILGESRAPTNKIIIRLEGPFIEKGPFFDPDGIHLFRYAPQENGYLALLTHEMVHAFREDYYIKNEPWNWPTFGYFDEGFAEYIAQLAEPEKTGFPFYGFPENVIVGNMVLNKKHLPHEVLRKRHEEFNQPCNIQTYPQRASWLRYIDETYGRDALLSIIYSEKEPTSSVVHYITGKELQDLDYEWETWILDKYEQIQDRDSIAQAYQERTSWYTYCNL